MKITFLCCSLALAGCAVPYPPVPPPGYVPYGQLSIDGNSHVLQPPVGADSTSQQAVNMLGFEWDKTQPDVVLLTVAVENINNIEGVQFTADGLFIIGERVAALTDYGSVLSRRQFSITLAEFKKIASARNVQMVVQGNSSNGLSSFGVDNPGAQVDAKFAPFLAAIGQGT